MKNEVFETIVSVLSNAKIDAATYNKNKENDAFISKIEDALKEIKKELWIPLSTGNYPPEMTDVQVTFIGYNNGKPLSCAYAYLNENQWYWTLDETPVSVEITAWRYNNEPYTD